MSPSEKKRLGNCKCHLGNWNILEYICNEKYFLPKLITLEKIKGKCRTGLKNCTVHGLTKIVLDSNIKEANSIDRYRYLHTKKQLCLMHSTNNYFPSQNGRSLHSKTYIINFKTHLSNDFSLRSHTFWLT